MQSVPSILQCLVLSFVLSVSITLSTRGIEMKSTNSIIRPTIGQRLKRIFSNYTIIRIIDNNILLTGLHNLEIRRSACVYGVCSETRQMRAKT